MSRASALSPDEAIDLGQAALALGAFDRPRVPLDRYRDHLAALQQDARGDHVDVGVRRTAAFETGGACTAARDTVGFLLGVGANAPPRPPLMPPSWCSSG